jgi:hypothetical protein
MDRRHPDVRQQPPNPAETDAVRDVVGGADAGARAAWPGRTRGDA